MSIATRVTFVRQRQAIVLSAMAVLILAAGGLFSSSCRDRNAGLFVACEKGDVERIKELLNRGAQVDARNRNGETPLMVAAGLLYPDAVRLLIEHGADVSAETNRGETPLSVALGARIPGGPSQAEKDLDQVVGLLIQAGAVR